MFSLASANIKDIITPWSSHVCGKPDKPSYHTTALEPVSPLGSGDGDGLVVTVQPDPAQRERQGRQ